MASRESERLFALGLIPQVDYQTALVPAASPKNYEQLHKDSREMANFETRTFDDAGYSTGTPFPTENLIDVHDVSFSLRERMSSQRLGRRALAAFGSLVTTAYSAGDTGAYKHVFSPLNTQGGVDLPAYSYVEKIGEPASSGNVLYDARYPSCCVDSFQLEGSETGFIMGTTQWRGSGKRIANSGVGFDAASYVGAAHVVLKANQIHNHFRNTMAQLKIYPQASLGGSPLTITCRYRSFNFGLENNNIQDQGYLGCAIYQTANTPESGAVRGSYPLGDQNASFEFVVLIDTTVTLDPFAKQVAQTELSAELIATGGAIGATTKVHKATLKINKMTYKTVQIDSLGGINVWRISAPPLAIGQTMPVSLEVENDVASYTTV